MYLDPPVKILVISKKIQQVTGENLVSEESMKTPVIVYEILRKYTDLNGSCAKSKVMTKF